MTMISPKSLNLGIETDVKKQSENEKIRWVIKTEECIYDIKRKNKAQRTINRY